MRILISVSKGKKSPAATAQKIRIQGTINDLQDDLADLRSKKRDMEHTIKKFNFSKSKIKKEDPSRKQKVSGINSKIKQAKRRFMELKRKAAKKAKAIRRLNKSL